MHRLPLCCLFLLIAGPALAKSPWDGQWFLVPSKSHASDHSFTLRKFADGIWRYDDGSSIYLFKTDGKAWPEPLEPDFTIAARQPDPRTLDFTESGAGKPIQRFHKAVSADGSRLVGTHTDISLDGTAHSNPTTDLREGPGAGLEGTWRELGGKSASSQSQPAPPDWTITSTRDGEMTWKLLATGEVLTGKLDGRARPDHGPQQPSGASFYWERVSDRQIEFYYLDSGHLSERATERLSEDGKTWTDTVWIPAYPDQKSIRVYQRR